MQFQVPQFIDTEDKVVGPLSLRQFGYVAAAGILSAILYFFAQLWLFVIGAIFFFGIAIALAFVKIEGRPFVNVIISAFNFYWRPQTYVWQPEHPVVHLAKEKIQAEAERSALQDILAKSVAKMKTAVVRQPAARPVHEPVKEIIKEPAKETMKAPELVQPKPAPIQPELVKPEPVQIKPEPKPIPVEPMPISRESVSAGAALHKLWENVQTGAAFGGKNSDRQFIEKKMEERYQVFQRVSGDRNAAKRVDYR